MWTIVTALMMMIQPVDFWLFEKSNHRIERRIPQEEFGMKNSKLMLFRKINPKRGSISLLLSLLGSKLGGKRQKHASKRCAPPPRAPLFCPPPPTRATGCKQ